MVVTLVMVEVNTTLVIEVVVDDTLEAGLAVLLDNVEDKVFSEIISSSYYLFGR